MKPPAQGPLAQLRHLVGRHVRLLVDLETKSGTRFTAGEEMRVLSVHRGRLELERAVPAHPRRWIRAVSLYDAAFIDAPSRLEGQAGRWWESKDGGGWRLFNAEGVELGTIEPSTKPRTGFVVQLAGSARSARWARGQHDAEEMLRLGEVCFGDG
jgi:hypothetical protein